MRKKILIIFYGVIILILLNSCEKFLDKTPDNRTEINSVDKISQLLASSYPQASYAAMLNSRIDFVSDKGPGFRENSSNSDAFFWRDIRDVSQDTPDYFWSKCYFSIAQVNHIIDVSDIIEGDNLNQFIAEAHLIRAFSHFLLVSLYSKFYEYQGANLTPGIPYVTEPERVVIKKYNRETVKECWDKIEEDMLYGISNLGGDSKYKVPKYHFNQKAAWAFASRFYLYKGEWQKVIDFCNNLIPNTSKFLANGNVAIDDPANIYAANNFQPWLTEFAISPGSVEIRKKYTMATNPSNLLLTEMSSRMSRYVNTWRYATKKEDTDATVSSTNVTGGSWGYRVFKSGDNYYVPKYEELFVRSDINASTGTIYTIFPYFRNEEILLNRAEAYAMTDRFEEAIADLNVFARQRVKNYSESNNIITIEKLLSFYSSILNNQDHYFNKYDAYGSSLWSNEKRVIISAILDFRRNEFMWEGLRYWDLIRYKIPVKHTTFFGEENTLFPEDDRWVLQIPESAILSDIKPNPRTNLLSKEW